MGWLVGLTMTSEVQHEAPALLYVRRTCRTNKRHMDAHKHDDIMHLMICDMILDDWRQRLCEWYLWSRINIEWDGTGWNAINPRKTP